jgi:UDP-glucose 4-epimerase
MRYLITGGNGYLGRHLVSLLNTRGHICDVIDNNSLQSKVVDGKHAAYNISILDINKSSNFSLDWQYDGVFHLAAKKSVQASATNPDLYWETNLEGTKQIIEFCKERLISNLVFTSSAAVYGSVSTEHSISETDATEPVNIYGETKLAAEKTLESQVTKSGISIAILRLFNLVGCQDPTMAETDGENIFAKLMLARKYRSSFAIYGKNYPTKDGTAVRDYVNVLDAALAHVKAMEYLQREATQKFKIYNVSSGLGTSVLDVVTSMNILSNNEFKYHFETARTGEPAYSIGNSSLIFSDIGWKTEIPIKNSIGQLFA